jgi:hypothetical protein
MEAVEQLQSHVWYASNCMLVTRGVIFRSQGNERPCERVNAKRRDSTQVNPFPSALENTPAFDSASPLSVREILHYRSSTERDLDDCKLGGSLRHSAVLGTAARQDAPPLQ